MVTLVHKIKQGKAYNLNCAIPVKGATAEKHEKGYAAVQTERVLTLGPNEKRSALPDVIVESPEIAKAIAAKQIQVIKEKAPVVAAKSEEKQAAADVAPQEESKKNKKNQSEAQSSTASKRE